MTNEIELDHPHITPSAIDKVIALEQYHVFEVSRLTVCCLTLINGYAVVGTAPCAHLDNFDAETGEKVARDDAKRKIWALEGYLLKEMLFKA